MTQSRIDTNIQDNGLGTLPEGLDSVHVKIGPFIGATPNVLYAFSDPTDVASVGQGAGVRATQFALVTSVGGRGARPVYLISPVLSVVGVTGAPVKTPVSGGTGTGTLSAAGQAYDRFDVIVEVTRGGTLGTGAFRYSLDGGDVYSPEVAIPGGGTYAITGTNVTLTWTPGGGPVFFEDGDLFRFTTRGPGYSTSDLADTMTALRADSRAWPFAHVVGPPAPAASSVVSSGTTPPVVTVSGTPVDYFQVKVDVILGGSRGTATFRYSLDGGTTYNGADILTAATYDIPGTGITLNFPTGTYNADNLYTFDTGNAAGLATLAAAVKTHADAMEADGRFVRFLLESPDATDAQLASAMAAFVSLRVVPVAGFVEADMPDGRVEKRPLAWALAARLAATPVAQAPDFRDAGPIANVSAIYRDERVTPNLEPARFATAQTDLGQPGFWFGPGRTMASPGSDFEEIMNCRVLDVACTIGKAALRKFQVAALRVKSTDGTILEADAIRVEKRVRALIAAALLGEEPQASDVIVQTVRTDNLLSTKNLRVKIDVIPLAYAKVITQTIGFRNPALLPVAA